MSELINPRKQDVIYRMQELIDSTPQYYQESSEANAIMYANATEIERKKAQAADLQEQLFVNTATWGLTEWERVLALPPRPNSSIEFRRNRILARLNGTAPATVANLTDVVNAHVADKTARIVEYNGEYRFEAEIDVDNPINMTDIRRDVEEVKPAHLSFGITGVNYGGAIEVGSEHYDFDVPYKKTNRFQTDIMDGRKSEVFFEVVSDEYVFDVALPITNDFQTDSSYGTILKSSMGVRLDSLHYSVGRPITNEFYPTPDRLENISANVEISASIKLRNVELLRAGTVTTGQGVI